MLPGCLDLQLAIVSKDGKSEPPEQAREVSMLRSIFAGLVIGASFMWDEVRASCVNLMGSIWVELSSRCAACVAR